MKERPLLMSTPMMKAILEGRKTETRRIVKPAIANILTRGSIQERELILEDCPHGVVGDQLWLRETWRYDFIRKNSGYDNNYTSVGLSYKAGGYGINLDLTKEVDRALAEKGMQHGSSWRPSIHMPRWASRIILQLTEVRAERLKFINENGVRAEGLQSCTKDGYLFKWGWEDLPWTDWYRGGAVDAYAGLWDKLNAERGYPWAASPWVWVLCFRRID